MSKLRDRIRTIRKSGKLVEALKEASDLCSYKMMNAYVSIKLRFLGHNQVFF